jgi:GH24 family phage-related lysozyme (muramidase)
MTNLSSKGIQAIIKWETGGESYYDKNPEWPGEQSGITIGVGWDLGHTSATETSRAWSPHLNAATLSLLVSVSGRKGEAAKEVLPHVRHLVIPWMSALAVFENVTIPVWYMKTLRIYPQVVDLPGDCAAALVSLCFNRGTSLSGERRREMSNIQALLRTGNLKEVPKQFREMKRLWPKTEGLRRRRNEEADLFESGLMPAGE